jgi:hypothetical protein
MVYIFIFTVTFNYYFYPYLHLAELNFNAELQEGNTTTCYLNGCVQMKKLGAE